MSALLIALIGALAGCGVTWLLGATDRAQAKKALQAQEKVLETQQKLLGAQQSAADAQAKIAKLESERDEREFFNQFSPKVRFAFEYPKGNLLTLEADEPFIVESIDCLTGSGANVGSQQVEQSSKSVQISISDEHLGNVLRLGPWLNRGAMSAAVQFRVHIQKDGLRKPHVVHAVIKAEIIPTPRAQVQVLKLVG